MKYNKDILDRFINEKVAINVETQQEWDDFMELLEENSDISWYCGRPTSVNSWNVLNMVSCVMYSNERKELKYGSKTFFRDCLSQEIIKFKDLMEQLHD